jgi:hypothetical protein
MLAKLESLEDFFSIRTFLLIIFIGILIIGFFTFMVKASKTDVVGTKRIYQGYGLFGLTYGLTRIFFLLSDYEIASNSGIVTQLHLIWVTTAYSVTFISILFIYFSVEKYVLNRKPVFTFIALGAFIVCLIALVMVIFGIGLDLANNAGPHRIAQYVLYITGPILAGGIMILYIIIFKNASGEVRRRSFLSIIGLILLFTGLLLDMDILSQFLIEEIRFLLSPIAFMVGTSIFFYAQR